MTPASRARLLPPHRRMFLAAFLLDFAVAVGLTAMPFFVLERVGGGAALSGTVGGVQMAVYAAVCLLSAGVVSRSGNALRWALSGVGIFAALFALVPLTGAPLSCVAAASAPFIGLALAWPALQTWMGRDPDPETRARHLAGFNTSTAFGFTLSPLLAGPLYDLDFRLPFAVLFALCAAVAGLVLSLPAGKTPESGTGAEEEGAAAGYRLTTGLVFASWGATFTSNALFAALRSVYPARVEELVAGRSLALWGAWRPAGLDAVGPATVFSWLAFLLSLATVSLFILLGRTRAWRGRMSLAAAAQLAAAACLPVLARTRSLAVMLLCFAVVGAAFGLCFFASLYYSLALAERRHARAAVNEGALGAGGFAGALGLGWAAGHAGLAPAFQWAPVLVAGAVALQLLVLRAGTGRA